MSSPYACLADTPELRTAMYRLRYETYTTELGSFKAGDLPEGIETDIYDGHSVHIVAIAESVVIGTLRLVKDSPLGFVMETLFPIPSDVDRSRAVEHSRGIVLPAWRDTGVYSIMLEFAYRWQRANGYTVCLGAPNTAKLSKILERLGWTAFGEPSEYHNTTCIPMLYRL